MIFVALSEAADKGELLLADGGMCRFHRRRDGVFVIREIIVLPRYRRKGIGRALVSEVLSRASATSSVTRAKCPASYESNGFWAKMGFTLVEEKDGINLWQRPAFGGTLYG